MSTDIAKMYRQVLINTVQRSLQRILVRDDPSETLKTYELNTVTYGQASANFLAIRCLFQLANEIQESKPHIARILREGFYVDDMVTGADSVQDAQVICREVSDILREGCFDLRKWCSNQPEILSEIGLSHSAFDVFDFSSDGRMKTLGLTWACQADCLVYNINIDSIERKITKRTVLSSVSKIFVPLGLLSPCTITAKILL